MGPLASLALFRVVPAPFRSGVARDTPSVLLGQLTLVSLIEWLHRWGNLAPTQCPTLPVSEVDCTDGLTLVQP